MGRTQRAAAMVGDMVAPTAGAGESETCLGGLVGRSVGCFVVMALNWSNGWIDGSALCSARQRHLNTFERDRQIFLCNFPCQPSGHGGKMTCACARSILLVQVR